MSDRVTVGIGIDTTELDAGLDGAMARVDAVVKAARLARQEVLRDVRIGLNAISGMLANYSQAMSLLGLQVDAFYGALIGMVLSTISMLISISAAIAATGVGIPVAAYIMAIAVGLNIAAIGKLLADKGNQIGLWADLHGAAVQIGIKLGKQSNTPSGGLF